MHWRQCIIISEPHHCIPQKGPSRASKAAYNLLTRNTMRGIGLNHVRERGGGASSDPNQSPQESLNELSLIRSRGMPMIDWFDPAPSFRSQRHRLSRGVSAHANPSIRQTGWCVLRRSPFELQLSASPHLRQTVRNADTPERRHQARWDR